MILARRLFLQGAISALLVFGVPSHLMAADAGAFFETFGKRAISELAGDLSAEERDMRFRKLLDEGFDIPAIGQFVLGRYWRSASQEERDEFLEVFRDYLTQRFSPLFAEYKGDDFSVDNVRDSKRDGIYWVDVSFTLGQEPIATNWRVRELEGNFTILNVKVENIDMAITLRDEYASVIRQEKSVSGLIERMRDLLAKQAFRPS